MKKVRRPEMLNKRETNKVAIVLLGALLVLVAAILAFEIWIDSNFFIITVSKTSMLDTLQDGDILYAEKEFKAERGDIVIVDVSSHKAQFEDTELIIKRLIAVEGDEICCEGGVVYLRRAGENDFSALSEKYVSPAYRTPDFPVTAVGAGEIFILGDHRDNSRDSQDVGCFSYEDIVGVVPQWAVDIKSFTNVWEGFRSLLYGWLY